MEMTLVSSSAIRALSYDGYTLSVEFHNSGSYDHPGVPESVYRGLMSAPSIGAFYNRYIRGKYR